jgi:hypothetical protein
VLRRISIRIDGVFSNNRLRKQGAAAGTDVGDIGLIYSVRLSTPDVPGGGLKYNASLISAQQNNFTFRAKEIALIS